MREQVPDVLVGDRPGGDGGVPHRDSRAEEPSRVEIEVLLGVGGDDAGLGEEQRDVGEGGEENVFQEPDHEVAGPARWSHGPVSLGAHVRARRDIRAAHRPRVSSFLPAMIVIGLTGGIGSGKTYVGARLVERGAVLIDADLLAREVVEPGRPAYGRVVERFGAEVVAPDGKLDRAAIAAIVFNDAQALADLNAIVHPEVGVEIAARLATESAGDHVVVLDIPLLVEAGNADRYPFDGVLVVDAPLDLVLDRLVSVRGMDRADAEARIANQASREERIRAADFVIMNMGSLEELDEMVARCLGLDRGLAGRGRRTLSAARQRAPSRYHADVPPFRVVSDFQPAGDQPAAIEALSRGVERGDRFQALLGITGSGKSATIAWTIENVQRPTLVLAPNKSLAAQLAGELRGFFPDNRVEYFVSYYDYYQPEAYLPSSDTYIEKDSSINDEIDRLRHSTTASLLTRRDVIVVASVSCIYGLGSPDEYRDQILVLKPGEIHDQRSMLSRLVTMHYERNDSNLVRGRFRVRGDTIEVHPAYEEYAVRIELFGDEIERMSRFDVMTGEILGDLEELIIFPATHYVAGDERTRRAIESIEVELRERLSELEQAGKLLEAQRLRMRTEHDLEMLAELGSCNRGRELQPPPRRTRRRRSALHAVELLPQRLAARDRRESRHGPAASRPIRRRPVSEGGSRRARVPPPLGQGQPAVDASRSWRRGSISASSSRRRRPSTR